MRESEDKYCTYGQKSGKHCFYRSGTRLFRSLENKAYGFIQKTGMIMWSDGAQSYQTHPCGMTEGTTCTVFPSNLVGRSGRSWKTFDEKLKTVETVKMEKSESKFCFIGSSTGRVCTTYDSRKRRFISDTWVTGTLHPNGQILWSNGFATQMDGDLCMDVGNREVGSENMRVQIDKIKERIRPANQRYEDLKNK